MTIGQDTKNGPRGKEIGPSDDKEARSSFALEKGKRKRKDKVAEGRWQAVVIRAVYVEIVVLIMQVKLGRDL